MTPGTLIDESWLDGAESRYLLAVSLGAPEGEGEETPISLAYTDVSTGDFFSKDTTLASMEDELARIAPREIVLDNSLKELWLSEADKPAAQGGVSAKDLVALLRVLGVHISFADPYRPPPDLEYVADTPRLYPVTLEHLAIALLRYHLQFALRESMPDLTEPSRQFESAHMQIDAATLHALEVRSSIRPGISSEVRGVSLVSVRGTLLSVINRTTTQSGHRLLIRTLTQPSTDLDMINSRLALVQAFVNRDELRVELRELLKNLGDIMRFVQQFRGRRGDGRNVWETGKWIRSVKRVLDRVQEELKYDKDSGVSSDEGVARLEELVTAFQPLDQLLVLIEESIDEEALLSGVNAADSAEEAEGIEFAGAAMDNSDAPKKKASARGMNCSRAERNGEGREGGQDVVDP